MKGGIIVPISEDELKNMIQNCIQTALEKHSFAVDADNEILKMHEVCKMLSVSKPTIYSWCEQGKLRSYSIGSRRFFLRSEVLHALKSQTLTK